MAIDPSRFSPVNVTDTCAVWNVLSSRKLFAAACGAACHFCIPAFVQYECLVKPRISRNPVEIELMDRLKAEQAKGRFQPHSCDIADLQTIELLEQRRRLGKGELSAIALAMKLRHAVMTDDQKARKLSEDAGHSPTQTTPHLFAWLFFKRHLVDSDKATIIFQHKEAGRPLGPHFEKAYALALQCLLNAR
jgi:predicted nucleic acid-binding protein